MEIIQLITDLDWNILDERFTGSKASGEVYINIFSIAHMKIFGWVLIPDLIFTLDLLEF